MNLSEKTLLLNGDTADRDRDDADEKRKRSLTAFALAAAVVVQSFLLVGVFPYSGFMAMHLVPGLNEENTGRYAGTIASSFMVGRTASSFGWGRISDRYGRVFVIRASLLLSAAFSILFGLAPTFYMALVWRCILGLCNGFMGPIKVLITEYNRGDKNKETEMMALVLGMWGFGFLINPAITGYLSDPVKQYPNSEAVRVFESFLTAFPFFLPNLVGCIFCLIAYVLVHKFVEETLPLNRRQSFTIFPCRKKIMRTVSSWGLFKHLHEDSETGGPVFEEVVALLPDECGGSENELPTEPATISSLWKRQATREHLLTNWAYAFLIVSLDESFPLFCLSKASGLAIHEKNIGDIFSGTGFFYITIQYFLLTGLVKKFGFYPTMRIGAYASVPFCALIPLSLITNEDAPEGTLAPATLLLLSAMYAVVRVFSLLVFSTLVMTTNRTVPSRDRGAMQGLSMLGGSIVKAVGPAFSGILFASSVGYFVPPTGSIFVFSLFSFLGMCVAVKIKRLQEYEKNSEVPAEVEPERGMQDDRKENGPPTF